MGIDSKNHFTLKQIDKTKSPINILIGERGDGKSYAIKERFIKDYLKTGHKFAYIRRWVDDIKNSLVTSYFADNVSNGDIELWTKGEYTTIECVRGDIFLGNVVNDKFICGECIGKAFALSKSSRYKSTQYPDFYNAMFEEFITNDLYISDDEPNILFELLSTIFRHRDFRCYLIGNSISRTCIYFDYWALNNINRMKDGDIYTYTFQNTAETNVTVSVELIPPVHEKDKKSLFFGKSAKTVYGNFTTKQYPIKKFDKYKVCFDLCITFSDSFKYIVSYCFDDNSYLHIYPCTKNPDADFFIDDYTSLDFMHFSSTAYLPPKVHDKFIECYNNNRVYFSDNTTAQNFYGNVKQHESVIR